MGASTGPRLRPSSWDGGVRSPLLSMPSHGLTAFLPKKRLLQVELGLPASADLTALPYLSWHSVLMLHDVNTVCHNYFYRYHLALMDAQGIII